MTGGEWWDSDTGENMLAGVDGDLANPVRLPDDYIVSFLQRIPAARDSFNRMVGNMLPEEQERLYRLYQSAIGNEVADPVILSDTFQNQWNTQGVKTCGPRGGTRIGGNR
jgi:hypothetical protein